MKPSQLFDKRFISHIEKQLVGGTLDDVEGEIEYVDAKQFLTRNKIDIVFKLYYIECREKHLGYDFAMELYIQHIQCITGGKIQEVINPEKNGIEEYIRRFDSLIDDVKCNGFDPKKSVVPVGNDNGIIDGSHRVAVAIYFGLKLPVFRIRCRSWKDNYSAFFNRGEYSLSQKHLDFMAYQYIRYKSPCYMAIVWPVSYNNPNYSIAIKLLQECCSVVYKKTLDLTYNGLTQLAMHAYLDSDWAGGFENGFAGVHGVAMERYARNAKTTVLLIDNASLEEMQRMKKIVRIVLGGGFCKIHITDNQQESIRLGKMLFNENSIDFLNNSYILKYPDFVNQFLKFRKEVLQKKVEDDVCVDTGGVMAIHGLRSSYDIDYLAVKDINIEGFDLHSQSYYDTFGVNLSLNKIIYNWFEHFYCFDIMFSSLNNVKSFKFKRGVAKDNKDIELIEKMKTDCPYENKYLLQGVTKSRKRVRQRFRQMVYVILRFFGRIIKKVIGTTKYHALVNRVMKIWRNLKK